VERAAAALEGRRILRLYPQPLEFITPTDVYTDLAFPSRDDDTIPYTYLNMVSSVDGRATKSGKASGIGSAADRLLMDALRSVSDGVMVGAGTLRAEKLTLGVSQRASKRRLAAGLSPQPLAIIVSGSSDPSRTIEQNLLHAKPDNTLVLVPMGSESKHSRSFGTKAKTIQGPVEQEAGSSLIDLRCALRNLRRDHGVRRLLVEGGPSINGRLIASGLVREIFMTLSPKLLGVDTEPQGDRGSPRLIVEDFRHVSPGATTDLNLLSSYLFESELYLRYELRRAEAT
jgi:2,5-diamino-6-(ribosylamino)-4(3H)-pyrimidinone 5'-phosphate reductase